MSVLERGRFETMRFRRLFLTLMLGAAMAFAQAVHAQQSSAPVLFFSDLISGPATGNTDTSYSASGNGVYVTLYGNFLTNFSSVTLNGAACLTVVSNPTTWLWYQRMIVQLKSTCTSGNFVVTTAAGTSNGIPFAVTGAGHIYYVSTNGNDSNAGTFASPWATLLQARNTMVAGDTTYAENGTGATVDDGSGWATCMLITTSGSAGAYISLVVYPGATSTIGSNANCPNAIRSGSTSSYTSYWGIHGFTVRGTDSTFANWDSNYWRVTGTDQSCPDGNGAAGCLNPVEASYWYVYGNNIHDTGVSGASAEYHGVYIATDDSYWDFGWNELYNVNGGRGLQTHSAPNGPGTNGYNLYGLSIHDNIVHDTGLDCMIIDTVSPNLGPVVLYNNVMYNCGKTTPPEGSGGWSAVNVPGSTEAGTPGSGNVEVFNNTFYAYGLNTNPPYADAESGVIYNGYSTAMYLHTVNNVFQSTATSVFPSGVPYFFTWNPNSSGGGSPCAPTDNCPWVFGTNNLVYGAGANSYDTANISSTYANPQLVNPTSYNLQLTSTSPAIHAGASVSVGTPFGLNNIGRDINGLTRPSPPSIGAYEYTAGQASSAPNPPTNLTVAVVAN
jgi:trimeric autotransporter adhesin